MKHNHEVIAEIKDGKLVIELPGADDCPLCREIEKALKK